MFLLYILFSCCCFFVVFVAFIFCYFFLIFGYLSKNISQKHGNLREKSKNEKCRTTKRNKKDILTRTVSTGVFTNSVLFFFFFVFLSISHFC